MAQNINAHSGSNIDARTTRHAGYLASQVIRKRIEEANRWIKCVAGMEQTKHRGLARVTPLPTRTGVPSGRSISAAASIATLP